MVLKPERSFTAAERWLNSLVNYERQAKPRDEFKLDNIRRLLKLAGNPQEKLKNVILVAGTKGKGSVCYMIEAGLRGCGLSTGLFLSPHLTTVCERIQLQGQPIKKALFARLVERFRPLVQRQRVSYFELLTAMAFDLFARRKVNYAVVEVGLGGRLDATNLTHPTISVITRIGYDHIKVLGNSLTKIAREKAGIMRPGKPVVIGLQTDEVKKELSIQAEKIGAQPVWVEACSRVWDEAIGEGVAFSCFTELGPGRIELKLLGRHQIENCRIALTVLGLLSHTEQNINFATVAHSLNQLQIPGRCEVVQREPVIIVDSCHNPDSSAALAGVIRDYLKDRVILIYGSLRGKLLKKTISHLVPYTEMAITVAPDSPRAVPPSILKGIFHRFGVASETAPGMNEALKRAKQLSLGKLPIVIAGSFYLAGEMLSHLREKFWTQCKPARDAGVICQGLPYIEPGM